MQLEGKTLSGPELDVLETAAEGLSARETAVRLAKSEHTIIAQRRAVQAKLGARNLIHAVALAYERGVLARNPRLQRDTQRPDSSRGARRTDQDGRA
jgi:DNA-binding CsgD family transcriptional regulator